jgi:hypothetical protein
MSGCARESYRSREMLAGNMPATAGRMRALPDNMRSEYPSQLGNRFARAEREHVARSSRHVVGLQ